MDIFKVILMYDVPLWLVIAIVILEFALLYWKETIKHWVNKENIGEITKQQKLAEKPFNVDSEELKSRLKIREGKEIGIHEDEKKAIKDLNSKYFIWLNSCSDVSMGKINIRSHSELLKYHKLMGDNYDKVHTSIMDFNLIISDEDLKLTAMEMINAVSHNVIDILPEYIRSIKKIEEDYARNGYTGNIEDKLDELLRKANEKIKDAIKIVVPYNHKFQTDSREYLKGK
jgi:hypothetical protein